jgi:hypothetical protein
MLNYEYETGTMPYSFCVGKAAASPSDTLRHSEHYMEVQEVGRPNESGTLQGAFSWEVRMHPINDDYAPTQKHDSMLALARDEPISLSARPIPSKKMRCRPCYTLR